MALAETERYDLELLRAAERYQQWVVQTFGRALRGRAVEIGCGIGNFTRWLAREVDHVVAIEPDPSMADAVEGLGLPNVDVMVTTLEDAPIDDGTFDCAVMINVLEHFADDAAAMEEAMRMLRPGGSICIFVPAHPRLYGSLDEHYDHYRRYTRRQVINLLRGADAEIGWVRYFNPLGAMGWLLAAKIARRPHLDPAAVAMSERFAVPLGRALDDRRVSIPFGQSVVAVARRPAT